MKAETLIKRAVVEQVCEWMEQELPPLDTEEDIEDAYDGLEERDEHHDAISEIREGAVETNIPAPSSRHYESKSVAMCINGQWVGWTYWYGGGKHGEPEGIDWDPYLLNCVEKEVVVTQREFTKAS